MKRTLPRAAPPADLWWTWSTERALEELGSSRAGLSSEESSRRLARHGRNVLDGADRASWARSLVGQLRSPLVLLLVFAAIVSALVAEWADAAVVLAIVGGSAALGAWHEHRAGDAVERLRARVRLRATVRRDGRDTSIPVEELVPGDVVLLAAGSLVPGDAILLATRDFFVGEAMLTGESFPVEKEPGAAPADAPLAARRGAIFFGTSVRSGTAEAVIARTGGATELGAIAQQLALRPPETELEVGMRRFGDLLMRVMIVLTLVVFAANVLYERPAIEAMLFAIALAVGISPELLPAILTVTLARGAQRMAERGVIVKRLATIESLGAIDVLCTDKTGTLTEGVIRLDAALDVAGAPSRAVLELAFANAALETGIASPLDEAIRARAAEDGLALEGTTKIDEVPYDFSRKRVGIVVEQHGARRMIVKGAVASVIEACAPLSGRERAELDARLERWSADGIRVLAVAAKVVPERARYEVGDERELALAGFLLFRDAPKEGAADVIAALGRLGIELKVLTGDARGVALHVARTLGIAIRGVLTGAEVAAIGEEALFHAATRTTIFAELDPSQKERIVRVLRKRGHVVGFLGDGINDAPALHCADVGISVEGAVDVAKDAADVVLGRRDLDVVRAGVEIGRTTLENTLKYVYTTSSANFGNMLSMAVSSVWLPFLPLSATQILLNNFLSDVPQTAVATDSVDPEAIARPRRWSVRRIRDCMVVYGLVSSAFDLLTFGTLLALGASLSEFRTAWFVESLLTELGIAFVVRTSRPLWKSRPGAALAIASTLVASIAVALPYLEPAAEIFGLVPLAPRWLALLGAITLAYLAASEAAKHLAGRWLREEASSARAPLDDVASAHSSSSEGST